MLSERRIVIGGEETVSTSIFPTDACYVALGHLHRAQRIAGLMPITTRGISIPAVSGLTRLRAFDLRRRYRSLTRGHGSLHCNSAQDWLPPCPEPRRSAAGPDRR